jgi:hypothetical protein
MGEEGMHCAQGILPPTHPDPTRWLRLGRPRSIATVPPLLALLPLSVPAPCRSCQQSTQPHWIRFGRETRTSFHWNDFPREP